MTRTTSAEVYRQITKEGLINSLQYDVYTHLYYNGPVTQAECAKSLAIQKPSISPRFAELAKLGAIHSVGKRPCRITGYNCMTWDVTDKLPVKAKKEDEVEPDVPVCPKCQKQTGMRINPATIVWHCIHCEWYWDTNYLKGWNDGWKAKRKQ